MQHQARPWLALSLLCVGAACTDRAPTTAPSDATERRNPPTHGAQLAAAVTATGFRESRVGYDWTLHKRVKEIMGEEMRPLPSTTTVHLGIGDVSWIE